MSQDELYNVLLQWLETFDLDDSSDTSDDITDGVQIAQVLHQIAPEWFSKIWLSKIKVDVGDNWRLKVSNLKKVIEGVTEYYQEYVNPHVNFVKPDAVRIGEYKDKMELVKLLQLILGCAVNCIKKQDHITKIMQMEESAQNLIMQSIQELESLLGSTPLSLGSNLNAKPDNDLDQLVSDLQMTVSDRDKKAQKCLELEIQLSVLQEEKTFLQEEKRKLEERLEENSADPMRDNVLRKQIDNLKEEVFKLETSKDDYRMKLELQEKEMMELQSKFDSLQQTAAEARHLKDEVDILREDADKVEKLESTVKLYKKKLEELSELKREMKLLEEKNLNYVQQTLELEEELKKANAWKTQAEMYKKQAIELRNNLAEETKKIDRLEFENCKNQEKLNASLKEKERLIKEMDTLKESNEELLCNKLQLKEDATELSVDEGKCSIVSEDMMSAIDLKRELMKLKHENSLLKISRKQSEDERISLMQAMYDDVSQQNKQLNADCRLSNQRILQLEAELKERELNDTKSANNNFALKELQSQLQAEKGLRLSESAEKDRVLLELKHVKATLFDALSHKEQEYEELEDKYRKSIEKARHIAKTLDFPELLSIGEEMNSLQHKVSDKENALQEVEKQLKQTKSAKDIEEKLLASAFFNLAQKKQQESMDQRLMTVASSTSNLPFLAKHRQSAFRRAPFPYSSK